MGPAGTGSRALTATTKFTAAFTEKDGGAIKVGDYPPTEVEGAAVSKDEKKE